MRAAATISIDYNFTACIPTRAAYHESTGGVYEYAEIGIRDYSPDYLLFDHRLDSDGLLIVVADGHLTLGIGPQPVTLSCA